MINNTMLWVRIFDVKKLATLVALCSLCTTLSIAYASDKQSVGVDLYAIRANGKTGYIAADGKVIIPPQYDDGTPFNNGRAWVYIDGKAVLLDGDGQVIAHSDYDKAFPFRDGFSVVGRNVNALATRSQEEPKTSAASEIKWGYVDGKGKAITDTLYYHAQPFHDGVAVVAVGSRKKDDPLLAGIKFALIDTHGKYLIEPGDRVFAGEISEDLILTSTDERDVHGSPTKWGYVDKHGNWVIEPKFAEAHAFHQGLAAAAIQISGDDGRRIQRWGYIDHAGAFKIEAEWDQAGDFSEGLAPVVKWTINDSGPQFQVKYIDLKGNAVLEPQGVLAHEFKYGIAIVTSRFRPLQNYLIDRTGKQLFPDMHEIFVVLGPNVIFMRDGDSMTYKTKEGQLIWSSK